MRNAFSGFISYIERRLMKDTVKKYKKIYMPKKIKNLDKVVSFLKVKDA